MKTGLQLIAEERSKQIIIHKRTIQSDVEDNSNGELAVAARLLITKDDEMKLMEDFATLLLPNWNKEHLIKMDNKPYFEKLIIAGALLAAEIDRVQRV